MHCLRITRFVLGGLCFLLAFTFLVPPFAHSLPRRSSPGNGRLWEPGSDPEPIDPMTAGRSPERGMRTRADTVFFGGVGFGGGQVVRGGVWDWEADGGEPPEFFPDGDPVGNQFRDGWTPVDLTTPNAPAEAGTGHWMPDGVYDLDARIGSFAHRAMVHDNDGVNDGPDPLDSPANPAASNWSVWIGTNLFLNPEHCAWERTAGYGDAWQQGIQQWFQIAAAPGASLTLEFFHRFAVENNYDTCWVDMSLGGNAWQPVGTVGNPQGVFTGGTASNPLPAPQGGPASVTLPAWPGGTGELGLRFRLATDGAASDESQGSAFLFAWQLDEITLRVAGVIHDQADFESDMDGWQPSRFAGRDFELTQDLEHPAGRFVPLSALSCPPDVSCPEACHVAGNVLIFADQDDCRMGAGAHTGLSSPAFSIGGPENPDLDDLGGRLISCDLYMDGGTGGFEAGIAFDLFYNPSNLHACPYTPAPGAPGVDGSFNWSRRGGHTYHTFGAGAHCLTSFVADLSVGLPSTADSVAITIVAVAQCCVPPGLPDANLTPMVDNVRFGVYDALALRIDNPTLGRYSDSFPLAEQAHQGLGAGTARADGADNPPCGLGLELPLRHVRADTAYINSSDEDALAYLRFKVLPGPCQQLANPFWVAFPPGGWHEARMDVGRMQGTGHPVPGTFMTCFHADDPHDGTSWGGELQPFEPCDDILPDGVFSPGTRVVYFFELRRFPWSAPLGTSPTGPGGGPIDTTSAFADSWLEFEVLPELDPQAGCDPTAPEHYANGLLVIADSASPLDRARLRSVLGGLGLDHDWYDVQGTNYSCNYNGIGRREDRNLQQPRPPVGGATAAQLEGYDVIWYYSGLTNWRTLSDQMTLSLFGGQPSADLQRLEGWLTACSVSPPHANRMLIMDGAGWASDIAENTTHGETFLANLGAEVLASDYAAYAGDQRRCARVTGAVAAPGFDGEAFGTGCPDQYQLDVVGPVATGEMVVNYVQSLEGGLAPVECADDIDEPAWGAIVRRADGAEGCERSIVMGISFVRLHDLNCIDQCLFEEWTAGGAATDLLVELFDWAGMPVIPTGVGPGSTSAPAQTRLLGARPNPAHPSARILFSLAERGHVRLRIYDVGGRLVRTLIDGVLEPTAAAREVVWDGRNEEGNRVGSGVYFYQLDAPAHRTAKKLVMLD